MPNASIIAFLGWRAPAPRGCARKQAEARSPGSRLSKNSCWHTAPARRPHWDALLHGPVLPTGFGLALLTSRGLGHPWVGLVALPAGHHAGLEQPIPRVDPALVGAGASGLCTNSSCSCRSRLLPRRVYSLQHSPGVALGRAKPLEGGLWVRLRLSPTAHRVPDPTSPFGWECLNGCGGQRPLHPPTARPPAVPGTTARPWGGLQGEALSTSPGSLKG